MSENLTFTEFIILDISKGDIGENLNSDDHKTILSQSEEIIVRKETFPEETRVRDCDEFIWIFLKQGRAKPRTETVFNIKTSGVEANPRREEQVELNKQTYLVIHKKSNRCFISNLRKLDYFAGRLGSILSKKIGFTPVIKSIDEVTKSLKILEEVTFVVQNDLFAAEDKTINLFGKGFSYLGLDKPDELHIRARFTNNSNIASVRQFFKKITNNPSFSSISCTCKDAEKIEHILNIDGACRRILVQTDRDENGLYNDDIIVSTFAKEFQKCYG